jgi:hypothetical protein
VTCTHTWLYKTPYFYLYASTEVVTDPSLKPSPKERAMEVVREALDRDSGDDPHPRISAMTQSNSNAYLEMKELKFGPVPLPSCSLCE